MAAADAVRSSSVNIVEPIRQAVLVEAAQERTFDTFIGRLAEWWPIQTRVLAPGAVRDVIVEAHLDGRIYEVRDDGSQSDWGRITSWRPPESLSFTWEVTPGPDFTEVEIRFQRLGPALTRVMVTHHGWERLDPALFDRYHKFANGWPGILRRFAMLAEGGVSGGAELPEMPPCD
ncbi:SRPBCC domain-containing protein [Micromonospora sp. NPDC000442]|uniref:SRPBCC domain-containing protein n=1 Tax=Micromonospora sp. NPDC000442 TaxID=3364217 RepID=UPI0036A1589D